MTSALPPDAPSNARRRASKSDGAGEKPWFWGHRWLLVLGVVGAIVFLPALRSPLLLDDYVQVAMLEGHYPGQRNPLDLYNFVTDANRDELATRGILPWWSDPHLTIRFFRPLSSALRAGDHAVFGADTLPAHLHSFAWWGACVVGAWLLFRRLASERAAKIATAMFALAPCHGLPLAWISNREVFVSLAFGTFALVAYTRLQDGERRQGWLAAFLFALSLAGGEYAIGFIGYFFALELFRARDGKGARLLRLAPVAVLVCIYLGVRRQLHCAAIGSGLYRDPFQEPLRFLETAPQRLAAVFIDGWLTSSSPTWDVPHVVLVGFAIAIGWVLYRAISFALGTVDGNERRSLRALLLGSVLALVPVLSVAPSPRTLGVATLGVACAIGVLVDRSWYRVAAEKDEAHGGELMRGAAAILVFARLVHGPGIAFSSLVAVRESALQFAASAQAVGARVDAAPRHDVNVLRGEWETMLWAPFALNARHEAPAHWRVLTLAHHALVLRKDEHTLEIVAPRDTGIFPVGEDDLFRSETAPVVIGEDVSVGGITVTSFALPKSIGVRVTFDEPIDDDGIWIAQKGVELVDCAPPKPGFGVPLDR